MVGQAANGREAVALARELRPDVCLFDIRMPELDGIEATRRLAGPGRRGPAGGGRDHHLRPRRYVYGALKAGARGFLLKDAGTGLLSRPSTPPPTATRSSPRASPPDCSPRSPRPAAVGPPAQPVDPLTAARGGDPAHGRPRRTNAEIADELHISLSTVKTHLTSLMDKLGARNRVEIAMWAYETGRVER